MGWGHSCTVNEEFGKPGRLRQELISTAFQRPGKPWDRMSKDVNAEWKECAKELSKQNSEP